MTDNRNIGGAGERRREKLLSALASSDSPLSAGALGSKFGVSRQIVVQDVALLRAAGASIVATNRGYILSSARQAIRVFKVHHTEAELAEELDLILENGGKVKNVAVSHRVYGRIEAELDIETKVHAAEFVRSIESGKSRPLMVVTEGYHYHTVAAQDEASLDGIERALRSRGFLVEE